MTGYQEVARTDQERQQLAIFLYEHLRTAPPFRFAVVGLECHEFEVFIRGALEAFDGLVVSRQIYHEAGRPREFQPFAPGYFWVPFTAQSRL